MATLTSRLTAPDGETQLPVALTVSITTSDGVLLDKLTHRVLSGSQLIAPGAEFTAPDLTLITDPAGAFYRLTASKYGQVGGRVWFWDGHTDTWLDELPSVAPSVEPVIVFGAYDDTDIRALLQDAIDNPPAAVASWDTVTDKPTEFPPSAHTHTTADVTGLATAISTAVATGDETTLAQAKAYADSLNVDMAALVALAEESPDIATLAAAITELSNRTPDVTQAELDAEAQARATGVSGAISTAAADATAKAATAQTNAIAAAATDATSKANTAQTNATTAATAAAATDAAARVTAERTAAATLTNKRLTKRVDGTASAATYTFNWDSFDAAKITAQAAALTLANPSGTPTAMQSVVIRLKDNGTARPITYGTQWRALGVVLPTSTVVGKTTYIGGFWNSDDSKIDVTATVTEA